MKKTFLILSILLASFGIVQATEVHEGCFTSKNGNHVLYSPCDWCSIIDPTTKVCADNCNTPCGTVIIIDDHPGGGYDLTVNDRWGAQVWTGRVMNIAYTIVTQVINSVEVTFTEISWDDYVEIVDPPIE